MSHVTIPSDDTTRSGGARGGDRVLDSVSFVSLVRLKESK